MRSTLPIYLKCKMYNECIASLMTYTDAKLIKLHEKMINTHRDQEKEKCYRTFLKINMDLRTDQATRTEGK